MFLRDSLRGLILAWLHYADKKTMKTLHGINKYFIFIIYDEPLAIVFIKQLNNRG